LYDRHVDFQIAYVQGGYDVLAHEVAYSIKNLYIENTTVMPSQKNLL